VRFLISIIFSIFLFSGCTEHHYHYIHPEYPTFPKIEKVPEVENAFIYNGCLYFNKKNTNLCGEDLKIVLTQIKKLRINENTCIKILNTYDEFVENQEQNATKEEVNYSFGFKN